MYSRASHNADFGDKKNQCISKTVYWGLLYRDIRKRNICEISAYTLYYKISVHWIFGTTLLCGIIVLHILLIFDFFPYLHALLGTTRLLILLKNSHLQIYLELIYDNN